MTSANSPVAVDSCRYQWGPNRNKPFLRHGIHSVDQRGEKMSKKNGLADPTRLNPFDTDDKKMLRVVIETPKGSRNKFAFEPEEHIFELKKVLPAGMTFPYDFGFVPSTKADDGDPVDVLVLMDEPAFTGCHVPVRLIGAIQAEQTDDGGEPERNDRLIGVASTAKLYEDVKELSDVAEPLLDQIEHFFISYNMEKGKKFEPRGRVGARVAANFVEAGRKRAKKKRRGKDK